MKLDGIWKTSVSLAEFHAPTTFKSYNEFKKRLDDVLSGTVTASAVSMIDEDVVETPQFKSEPQPNIPSVDKKMMTLCHTSKNLRMVVTLGKYVQTHGKVYY